MSDLYQIPTSEISQGDIIDVAPHVFVTKPLLGVSEQNGTLVSVPADSKAEKIVANYKPSRALLLTHDCVIDKPKTKIWQVCPVLPIGRLEGGKQGDVRKNRIYTFLHLPAFRELPESFVDFSVVTSLDASIIKEAHRIVSLSDLGRQALYVQYIRWFTRWELASITCPACNAEFDAALALPVRSQ